MATKESKLTIQVGKDLVPVLVTKSPNPQSKHTFWRHQRVADKVHVLFSDTRERMALKYKPTQVITIRYYSHGIVTETPIVIVP